MAESVVMFVIEKIGTLLIEEKQLLGSVSGEVEQLQQEFIQMKRLLKDADKKQDENESVRGWVSDIRDLAYDVEDVIDSFISNSSSRRKGGLWNNIERYALIPVELMDKHKVANEINTIRGKLTNLTNSSQTYGITISTDVPSSSSEPLTQRKTHAHVKENIVGFHNDAEILLKELVGEPKKHQVVSIYGMGGSGKSTLAKKLYHHNDVKSNFDAFAWVFVSQQFRARQILEEILIKLLSSSEKHRISTLRDGEISEELYQLLETKKCLVVIDDLWEKKHWDELKHAFPIGDVQGTIILTTRNKTLGLHVDLTCFNHKPYALSSEESWELFQTKAFPREDSADITAMEELGKEMVKLCSGLPLAIIVLGGVLATKSSLNEWRSAHKTFGTYSREEESNEYSNIHAIIALSYSELPFHLKPCFLSLAQFPEDYSIRSKILFRLWMAEGIVTREPLEDTAENYLQELVDRCIVQIEEIGLSGGIKTCRLHDLIRDLSLSKANQENFLEFIHDNPENSKARRVTVGSGNPKACLNSLKENRRHMRSLTIRSYDLKLSEVREFKLLRVLELDSCWIEGESMKEIGALIHLKYLRITECSINHIPSSLGNLKSLQTLIIISWTTKLKISKKIWNLQELRYLHIKWGDDFPTIGKAELQVKNLRNLRTLRCTGPIYVEGLKNLPNLRKLETTARDVETLPKVLNSLAAPEKMANFNAEIENFKSRFTEVAVRDLLTNLGQLQKLRFSGKIEKFPDVLSNLTKLTLNLSLLDEDPMDILGRFPNLTYLDFDCAFVGRTMVCSAIGFPKLKTLHLRSLHSLVEWRVEKGAMSSLCHLCIHYCPYLGIPNFECITTLSKLEIWGMPKGFTDRLKGEDFDKVRHIASITITGTITGTLIEDDSF